MPLVIGKSSRILPSISLYRNVPLYRPLQTFRRPPSHLRTHGGSLKSVVQCWESRLEIEEGERRASPRGAGPDRWSKPTTLRSICCPITNPRWAGWTFADAGVATVLATAATSVESELFEGNGRVASASRLTSTASCASPPYGTNAMMAVLNPAGGAHPSNIDQNTSNNEAGASDPSTAQGRGVDPGILPPDRVVAQQSFCRPSVGGLSRKDGRPCTA